MLKLPPHNIVIPTLAMFRDDPLPQELWETWSLLRALAWVNKYEFTPPMTIRELLDLHNQRKKNPIDVRGLQKRLKHLKDLGWLEIRFTGRANVFVPLVPPTLQKAEHAAARREPASVTLPHSDEADSPRMTAIDEGVATRNQQRGELPVRPEPPVRGNSNSTVVVANQYLAIEEEQQHGVNSQFAPNSQFTPAVDGVNSQFAPNSQFTPAVDEVNSQFTHDGQSKEILSQVGVEGRNLEMLAATVMPNVARRWAEWVPVAPHSFKDPVGYLVRRLLNDPNAEPPRVRGSVRGKTVSEVLAELRDKLQAEAEDAEDTEESFQTPDEIWNAALDELHRQLSEVTFDQWLRDSRVMNMRDGDTLYLEILVRNSHAVEWLERHLHMTIQRTVAGIVGRAVDIRYVAPEQAYS